MFTSQWDLMLQGLALRVRERGFRNEGFGFWLRNEGSGFRI